MRPFRIAPRRRAGAPSRLQTRPTPARRAIARTSPKNLPIVILVLDRGRIVARDAFADLVATQLGMGCDPPEAGAETALGGPAAGAVH